MDWDRIEGDWERLKGSVKREWDRLTDEQLDTIAGKREALSRSIQDVYGISPERTERQVSFWQGVQRPKGGLEPEELQGPPIPKDQLQ